MLCRVQCRAVAVRAARRASGEWSREQPVIFSAFSFWMTSTCLGLCDFIYGFSLPFHKPIHLPFYVTSFGCLLFYLFSFSADGPHPPCSTRAPPLGGHAPHFYPLSTSRNQVLVQSQCYCQFLVGSTHEPFKNRLLFHRLESQYRARTYVTEYISCSVSLARQRQTQQTCSRCIAPLRSIGTQHTKALREWSKSIKSRQLSSRSRSTPMPRTERSA